MRLSDLGEFGLIDRIAANIAARSSVKIGIGDDAAAIEPEAGHLSLLTSDMLIEGVHFDLKLSDPVALGRKSLAVNLSDLAAMGAKPKYFLLSLAIPKTMTLEFLDDFIKGLMQRAQQFHVTLIGGDTCSSKGGLAISITAIGEQLPDLVVSRTGAQPGDLIFVTGTVGDSALGLELLRKGVQSGPLVMRHLDPEPRVSAGVTLAESRMATSMIDISDGLLADLGHILDGSGVGARVDLAGIPLSEPYNEVVANYSEDPFAMALSGGEDYELLFTVPQLHREQVLSRMAECNVNVSLIGEITASDQILSIITPDGLTYETRQKGYNHFVLSHPSPLIAYLNRNFSFPRSIKLAEVNRLPGSQNKSRIVN